MHVSVSASMMLDKPNWFAMMRAVIEKLKDVSAKMAWVTFDEVLNSH